MRLFTCPTIIGSPRLTPEACGKRHKSTRGVKSSVWAANAPVEWFASLAICRRCEVGRLHAAGQDADVRYVEVGTLRGGM